MNKKLAVLFILVLTYQNKIFSQVYCIQCYNQLTQLNPTAVNLIQNGSFETNNCPPSSSGYFCPFFFNFECSLNNWTCTGGGSNTYAHIVDNTWTVIPNGSTAAYLGNYFANSCTTDTIDLTNSDTSCLTFTGCVITTVPSGLPINSSNFGGTTGLSLSQMMTGLVVGDDYTLDFWVGGESDLNLFNNPGIFAVDVGYGNIILQADYSDVAPTTHQGKRVMISFHATSTSQLLKFTNWGHICSSCTEVILDDVHLYHSAEAVTVPVSCPDTTNTTTPCLSNFVPEATNVFTPNNDNTNDIFYPLVKLVSKGKNYFKEYDLKIYDRWGTLVFYTTSWLTGWNGKNANGTNLNEGVYFWILQAKDICNDKSVNFNGNVMLLR